MSKWIGVDLDGTLAEYHGWQGIDHIGLPVPYMIQRVQEWLEQGKDVRIFTARASGDVADRDAQIVRDTINKWCLQHLGKILPITNVKDFEMIELWDDRAVQVVPNTGLRADGKD